MRRSTVWIGFAAALLPAGLAGPEAVSAPAPDGRPAWIAGEAGPSAGGPPSLTRIGPYGSPLALLPRSRIAIPAIGDVALPPEPVGVAAVAGLPRAAGSSPVGSAGNAKSRWIEDEDDEEDAIPTAPGTLRRERVKIPEPSTVAGRKARRSPTSLTPDYEVPLGSKASLGMSGEVGKVELERSGPVPSVKARDLGASLILQYRFGQ